MWEWLTWLIVAAAVAQALLAAGFAIAGRTPNDYTLGATAVTSLLLLGQVVVTVVLQVSGQGASGDIVEFWAYLGTAALLGPASIAWGLIERTRWSTAILAVVGFSLAVMVFRMHDIWFVQVA